MTKAPKSIQIDRDKLRAEIRKIGHQYVFSMLDEAIELLPLSKLHQIAKKHFDLKRLCPDAEATNPSLITEVKLFEKACLASKYYESFGVNSKNSTQQSAGTSAWIARYLRLLDRCVIKAKKSNPVEVRQAMDILFGLLNTLLIGAQLAKVRLCAGQKVLGWGEVRQPRAQKAKMYFMTLGRSADLCSFVRLKCCVV